MCGGTDLRYEPCRTDPAASHRIDHPDQIAHAGGGLAEAMSEVTDGHEAQGRFLFSGTVERACA